MTVLYQSHLAASISAHSKVMHLSALTQTKCEQYPVAITVPPGTALKLSALLSVGACHDMCAVTGEHSHASCRTV